MSEPIPGEAHLASKTARLMAQQLQTIAHVASFKHGPYARHRATTRGARLRALD
ncbi:hypothetical protein [Arthrobacter sp. UYCu723]